MKPQDTQSYQLQCLSIDADEINLHLIQSMAEDVGLSVQSFQSPVQALQYASDNVVGIVIVDIFLGRSVEVYQIFESLQDDLYPAEIRC